MEIPLVAEALRIPGLAARLLSDLAGAWASVALIVAGFAAFYGFLSRAKLALLRYGRSASVISFPSACSSSGDDDEDDVDSSESPSDDEEDEDPPSSSLDEYNLASGNNGVDWRPDGGCLDLALGGTVVRTWDGMGLGFDRAGGGLISLVDMNRGQVLRSFLAQVPDAAVSLASPAVVLSEAEGAAAAAAAVSVWDAREAGVWTPAAAAEWRTARRRRVVGIAGGEGRVYVGDDDGVVTAADWRGGGSPLVVETWRERRLPLLPSSQVIDFPNSLPD